MDLGISSIRRGSLWQPCRSLWPLCRSLLYPTTFIPFLSRMPKTPRAATKKNAPRAPKKGPPKKILPSSQYYTTKKEDKANNFSPENLNATPVNLEGLIEMVKHRPGNGNLPYHQNINFYKPPPKMMLPPHLQGGKPTRKRGKKSSKKRTLRK
jgi:hypothetical protein